MTPRCRWWLVAFVVFGAGGGVAFGAEGDGFGVLPYRVETVHYIVVGTAPPMVLNRLGTDMDYLYECYDREFQGVLADERESRSRASRKARRRAKSRRSRKSSGGDRSPATATAPAGADAESTKHRIVVFAERAEFDAWREAYVPEVQPWASAFYTSKHQALVGHLEGGFDAAYPSFFHEGFHQFLRRYVPAAPTWIEEGLAEYYGQGKPTPNGWVFPPHERRFRQCAALLRAGRLTPLDELLMMDQKTFYGGDRPEAGHIAGYHYSAAYTFVYLMLESEPSRAHIREYVRALAKSEPGNHRAVTAEHFPPKVLARLQQRWVQALMQF